MSCGQCSLVSGAPDCDWSLSEDGELYTGAIGNPWALYVAREPGANNVMRTAIRLGINLQRENRLLAFSFRADCQSVPDVG